MGQMFKKLDADKDPMGKGISGPGGQADESRSLWEGGCCLEGVYGGKCYLLLFQEPYAIV